MRFSEQFVLDVAFKEITLFLCVCAVRAQALFELHNPDWAQFILITCVF